MDIPLTGFSIFRTRDILQCERDRRKAKLITAQLIEVLLHDVHRYKALLDRNGIDVKAKFVDIES